MLARKGIFTTPSITQSHVSVIRALARVACITSHLHILYHILRKKSIPSYRLIYINLYLFLIKNA